VQGDFQDSNLVASPFVPGPAAMPPSAGLVQQPQAREGIHHVKKTGQQSHCRPMVHNSAANVATPFAASVISSVIALAKRENGSERTKPR
jgi:hypothetical protein